METLKEYLKPELIWFIIGLVLLIAEQYLNEFGKSAKTNNTIIIPSNLSDIAGIIKAASSVIKEQTVAA